MSHKPIIPFIGNVSTDERSAWVQHLQAALPDFRILPSDGTQDAELAIVANPDPQQLVTMPNLKWVQSLWAGVEKLVATLPPEIEIIRMVDPQLAKTMAEAVLTMTLYLHRDVPKYARQQSARVWEQHCVILPEDRTVGVLGLGSLGGAACASLVQNGFDVRGWSRTLKTISGVQCYSGDDGLQDLLRHADIVVVLLPLTNDTHRLLNRDRLAHMKRGASLINFARGPIVDADALLDLLDTRELDHAILDVFNTEPLPADTPLWSNPHLTILPHISAPTNMKTACKIAADNIHAYFKTGQVPAPINREHGY